MHNPSLILLVEDNVDVLEINRQYFEMAGYTVKTAMTLAEARKRVADAIPDIMVLDIMLPDGSGLDFCGELRNHSPVPVLFLTCLDEEADIVAGLKTGGDEYMTKPYRVGELLARVEALLRRVHMEQARHAEKNKKIAIGPLMLDTVTQRAYLDGADILLKPREFALLLFFVRNAGKGFTPEEIYEAVWGQMANNCVLTVKVHVAGIRKKTRMDEGSLISIEMERRRFYVCSIKG